MEREHQNQERHSHAAANQPEEKAYKGKVLSPPVLHIGPGGAAPDPSDHLGSALIIQPSLKIGGTGDAYEREAESVAAQVVGRQRLLPQISPLAGSASSPAQRRVRDNAPLTLSGQLVASQSEGRALEGGLRQEMEGSFAYDFSQVRIHTGSQAAQMSRAIGAHAFTQGSHIYFNSQGYQGGHPAARQLLAHELTHVVQQGAAQRKPAADPGRALLGARETVDIRQRDNSNTLRRHAGGADAAQVMPATGTKDTNLENTYGKFKIKHGLVGLPGEDGHAYGTYHFELDMQPKKATGTSKIGFVQTVRRGTSPGNWSTKKGDPGISTEERAKRTNTKGWRVDRSSSGKTPIYGASKKGGALTRPNFNLSRVGMGNSRIIKFGKYGGSNAYLIDIPAVVDPSVVEFATTAMAVDSGTQFGCIAWGFQIDSSTNTWNEETPKFLTASDSRMKERAEAMEHWNEKVATEGSGIDKVPGL